MSKELPILFNTDMVQAILEGRKTVTRRVCKDGNDYTIPDMSFFDADKRTYAIHNYADKEHIEELSLMERTCPICPEDILYVRETWQYLYALDGNEQIIEDTGRYYYAATDTIPFDTYTDSEGVTHENIPWRPSIHMPKAAARIWLKVTDVRVERLQDITEEQAKAEGAVRCYEEIRPDEDTPVIYQSEDRGGYYTLGFKTIWNSLTKKPDIEKYGWDADPYVWVIEFERREKPEKSN